MDERVRKIHEAAAFIREQVGDSKAEIAIELGSGLGKVAEAVTIDTVVPFTGIPHFKSRVIGLSRNPSSNHLFAIFIAVFGQPCLEFTHARNLSCILLNLKYRCSVSGKPVFVLKGRFHYYVGYSMEQVTFPVRVLAALGVRTLLVTNAAGGLNRSYATGDLMIIRDQINFMPNPLIGPNMDGFGERFTDMTAAYDPDLIKMAEHIADREMIKLRKGIYLANTGPSFETPAETRFYLTIGADAVGMSTVPEVIVARHCGMRVFGVSVISNLSNLDNDSTVLNDGDDVLLAADAAADKMQTLFTHLIAAI